MVQDLDDSFLFCGLEIRSSGSERNRAGFKLHQPQGCVAVQGNTSQGKVCVPVMAFLV